MKIPAFRSTASRSCDPEAQSLCWVTSLQQRWFTGQTSFAVQFSESPSWHECFSFKSEHQVLKSLRVSDFHTIFVPKWSRISLRSKPIKPPPRHRRLLPRGIVATHICTMNAACHANLSEIMKSPAHLYLPSRRPVNYVSSQSGCWSCLKWLFVPLFMSLVFVFTPAGLYIVYEVC